MSKREATDRSSSETAGGGLRSDSTIRTSLGLSTSSCTKERATDTEKRKERLYHHPIFNLDNKRNTVHPTVS